MDSITAFQGLRRLASGEIGTVAVAVKATLQNDPTLAVLSYRDANGEQIDLDLRGSAEEIVERYRLPTPPKAARGRPRLGVVAREITLMPRHWEWLGSQPGGASVALRKLVEEASKSSGGVDQTRTSRDACYRFLSSMAGNLPYFEQATRALYAGNQAGFRELIAVWPMDVQVYALKLGTDAWPTP
ncbi:MAG: DUF2239 family protein [Chlorobia bacterium]|nr:DUF2239 family protein [Fimbriimonadaceae bacterium]